MFKINPMKKIAYSTIILLLFSISMILFQISCRDEAVAQLTGVSFEPKYRFLYTYHDDKTNDTEFWTAKHDGTDKKQIPITLPSELTFSGPSGRLTSDGETLIFTVKDANNIKYIYSIFTNGTDLKMIVDGSTKTGDGKVYEVAQTY
jgi:hypothetical protein